MIPMDVRQSRPSATTGLPFSDIDGEEAEFEVLLT